MDLVTLQGWLDNASFAVLFLTMLIYWSGAAFPSIPFLAPLGTAGMAIANLCIAALLSARWIEAGYFPLSNLYESLFFVAWGITAVHLLAERMSQSRLVGTVTAPVAMGITAFAALSLPETMQTSEPLVPALKSNWLMMHVSVMLLSYAALMVGSLMAIAFLIVTRGQTVELKGSSVGTGSFRTGRDRLKPIRLPSEGADDAPEQESGMSIEHVPADLAEATSPVVSAQRQDLLHNGTQETGQETPLSASSGASSVVGTATVKSAVSDSVLTQSSSELTGKSSNGKASNGDGSNGNGSNGKASNGNGSNSNGGDRPSLTSPLSPQRLSLADTLDNVSYRIIGLGFPLLTIGIIAGAVWANEAWGSYWSWDPKETWALITWLVFAAYLHARITRGWQGRRPAILAASGFVVVWVCYLGVNLLGKGLHSYGWFF